MPLVGAFGGGHASKTKRVGVEVVCVVSVDTSVVSRVRLKEGFRRVKDVWVGNGVLKREGHWDVDAGDTVDRALASGASEGGLVVAAGFVVIVEVCVQTLLDDLEGTALLLKQTFSVFLETAADEFLEIAGASGLLDGGQAHAGTLAPLVDFGAEGIGFELEQTELTGRGSAGTTHGVDESDGGVDDGGLGRTTDGGKVGEQGSKIL